MKYRSIWKLIIVLASITIINAAAVDSDKITLLHSEELIDLSSGELVMPSGLSVSPDGGSVLYSTITLSLEPAPKMVGEIYSIDSSGRSYPHRLAYGKDAVWSPDGERIAYAGNEEGLISYTDPVTGLEQDLNSSIYVMDANGTTTAYPMQGNQIDPRWSPDGKKIAYYGSRFGSTVIYVMDIDGSNRTTLLDDPLVQSTPIWSPDGTRIVFSSNRTGNPEIYMMDLNSTESTQLTNNLVSDKVCDWSLDGDKLLFGSGDFLCTMNPDGTEKEILTEASILAYAHFSPDRKTIYYSIMEAKKNILGLYKIELVDQ